MDCRHAGSRSLKWLPARWRKWPRTTSSSVRQVQPKGPFHLLGWSFGGLVAHAMATQLQDAGETVSLLALLDSYPIERPGHAPDETGIDDARLLANQLKALGYYSGDEPLQISSALDILRRKGDMLSNLEEHQVYAIIQVLRQNSGLARNFVPQRFHGEVLLFAATQGDSRPEPDKWKSYVNGRISVYEMNCEHEHMTRPDSIGEDRSRARKRVQKAVEGSRIMLPDRNWT